MYTWGSTGNLNFRYLADRLVSIVLLEPGRLSTTRGIRPALASQRFAELMGRSVEWRAAGMAGQGARGFSWKLREEERAPSSTGRGQIAASISRMSKAATGLC